MSIPKQHDPVMPVKETAEKLAKKADEARTKQIFRRLVISLLAVHLGLILLIERSLVAYGQSWVDLVKYIMEFPFLFPLVLFSFFALYKGIDLWRHPDPDEIHFPEFPPIPDLRFTNDMYIGSAWTREGKQPGDLLEADDELMENPHIVMKEKGLFGNVHCKGGVGGGKTSTLIIPFIDQGIAKYPLPLHPDEWEWGSNGKLKVDKKAVGKNKKDDPDVELKEIRRAWNPYLGLTYEEALEKFEELKEIHNEKKWGMFVMDPKGDITEFVQRTAKLAGREEDVIVLRPDGEYTYNPLVINANSLVQAETVMDGIEAVSGQTIQHYWRGTMSEWLANALAILRVADPTRMTFKNILKMARNETLRTTLVAEAESIMRISMEREEKLRRLGKVYKGVKVNPAAIEFFRDWDDEENDPNLKRAVVSGIKMQSKFFVDDELADFLCPEMQPTFEGFDHMIDQGKIVVLRMPLDQYGPVAKVLGVLVLADAQQAARGRINRPDMNQDRVVAFIVDEISAYMNKLTKDFIAMNRQSRVCFLAAHQSQAQLVQQGDRGFETSFNDNLRTKISYNAPNAESARREVAIFGSRKTARATWTESQSFQRIERMDGESFAPAGPEGKAASVRYDEIEKAWFPPEEFMMLKTGENILMEFDGNSTLAPRKIVAPAFWQLPRAQWAGKLEVDDQKRKPHPVTYVRDRTRDFEYLTSGLQQSGFAIIEPLAGVDGALEGFRFILDVGTLVVSCDNLEDQRDMLVDKLTDPQILVLFTDFHSSTLFFVEQLGLTFERVLDLVELYNERFPEVEVESLGDMYEHATGESLLAKRMGAWEAYKDVASNKKRMTEESRNIIEAYRDIGQNLDHKLSEEELEERFGQALERIGAIKRGEENPASTPADESEDEAEGGVSTVDSPQGLEDGLIPPTYEEGSEEDPFAGDSYPENIEDLFSGDHAQEQISPSVDEISATVEEEEKTGKGAKKNKESASGALRLPGLEADPNAQNEAPKVLRRKRRKRPKQEPKDQQAIRTLLDLMYAEAEEEEDDELKEIQTKDAQDVLDDFVAPKEELEGVVNPGGETAPEPQRKVEAEEVEEPSMWDQIEGELKDSRPAEPDDFEEADEF